MAIDTKKIVKDAKEFKTLQAEAEKYVKEIADIYAASFKNFGGMEKSADTLVSRIADGKNAMNNHLSEIKRWAELAKSVKSDAEQILRREAEGSAYLDELQENWIAAEKAAKADKTNKGLAAKAELMGKALAKQSQIYGRINEEYFAVRTVLDTFHSDVERARYEVLERAREMEDMMEKLIHTVKMIQFSRSKTL